MSRWWLTEERGSTSFVFASSSWELRNAIPDEVAASKATPLFLFLSPIGIYLPVDEVVKRDRGTWRWGPKPPPNFLGGDAVQEGEFGDVVRVEDARLPDCVREKHRVRTVSGRF